MGQYSPPLRDNASLANDSWAHALRDSSAAYDELPTRRSTSRSGGSGGRLAAPFAAAAVAVLGGLAWAGVVVATNWDIGILAWLVGAAVGRTTVAVAGGPVRGVERGVAGLLAAAGIVLGKYVIFVHAVKTSLGAELAAHGIRVGYLDGRQMSIFVHNVGKIVHPIYALWIGLAFFAAMRVAGGAPLRRVRRS
jgi:hypothetical protein